MQLPSPFRAAALCTAAVALVLPLSAFAASTVTIQKTSGVDAPGTWTLLKPNHESVSRTDAQATIDDLWAGHYTLFITPPDGTNASIEFYSGSLLVETVTQPQYTFDLADGQTVQFKITQDLVNFGRVGVNSDPNNMPFVLQGPGGLTRTGVTPMTYERMPIGNYSVQYTPTGCNTPPGKSDVLKKDQTVHFSVTVRCDTFQPTQMSSSSAQVTTDSKGVTVPFNDVPMDAWYTPFIATVVRRGILTGYRDAQGNATGEFGPDNPVTIAELTKIVHEMMGIDETMVTVAPRTNDALGKWFTKYAASAEDLGWSVYQDPLLNFLRPATRGEVVATLLQALDISANWPKGDQFKDVVRSTPYAGAIETAAQAGIVGGATDENGQQTGYFHPLSPITRAEMAKILITIQQKYQSTGGSSSNSSSSK